MSCAVLRSNKEYDCCIYNVFLIIAGFITGKSPEAVGAHSQGSACMLYSWGLEALVFRGERL
jgi:hypothetical protein